MALCQRCGEENPDRARFCLNCGAPLQPAAPTREVRKIVTVVFADVAGSTTLGEQRDPEAMRRVMARYFAVMRGVIERHGGTVEKFIGDAVMAVFGIPVLHEDDALRAVRAAAAMRAALEELNDELAREWGVTLSARIGVNTGEVVAGDATVGQTLVTGDAVNTAARLEQSAAPGEVLIGEQTYLLVRDAVRVEPLGALSLKGKEGAVAAYRLLEVLPDAPGHLRRLDSPLVGRERERLALEHALERTISGRSCQLFTVLGAAGVGKSRLVQEFLVSAGERGDVLRGRCLPYGEGITFWPVLEIVRAAAGIADTDDVGSARGKIEAALGDEPDRDLIAERVADVVGVGGAVVRGNADVPSGAAVPGGAAGAAAGDGSVDGSRAAAGDGSVDGSRAAAGDGSVDGSRAAAGDGSVDGSRASGSAEETFWAVRKLLESLAQQRPLVVVVDDIHWAEPTLLDLIEHIADWSRDAPLLLVCLARPELLEDRPTWGGGKLNATTILLDPLDETETDELIDNLLGGSGLDAAARGRIREAAEGNPLFVEEMIAMLVDDGLLRRSDGRWDPVTDLSRIPVPPSIHALLAARLDRLQPPERRVVDRAAVVGKVFWRGAVAELSPEVERPAVGANLMTLVRKDLIRLDRSTFTGDEAFRFRHLLIRDAAYEGIPKEERSQLHERFGGWLERTAGDRVAEYEEIIAYHLEQAARYRAALGPLDPRARRVGERAAEHLLSAAGRARARGDPSATAHLLRRAADLLPAEDARRAEALPALAEALIDRGELAEAEEVLNGAVETATRAGLERAEWRARVLQAQLAANVDPEGSSARGERVAAEAIERFERLGDELGLSWAWTLRSEADGRGRDADRLEALDRAAEYARRAGDDAAVRRLVQRLGAMLLWGPPPVSDGLARLDSIAREAAGDRGTEAWVLRTRAGLRAMEGRFDEARELLETSRRILLDLGQRYGLPAISNVAGLVETLAGDHAAAERVLAEGCRMLEEMGEKGYLSTQAAAAANACAEQGKLSEAMRYAQISRETAASDDAASQTLWRTAVAKVRLAEGRQEEAERLAREAIEALEDADYVSMQADALVVLARVLAGATDTRRRQEAIEALRRANELYERKGIVVLRERLERMLADLGEAVRSEAVG